MRDRSINEQLREQAERQGLIEPDEGGSEGEAATGPLVRQPITPLMIATVTALDLLGALVLLTVSIPAGVAVIAVSGAAFALWLNLRLRAARRSILKEQERERASQ
jgi:Flp pilus assembly protein TadB